MSKEAKQLDDALYVFKQTAQVVLNKGYKQGLDEHKNKIAKASQRFIKDIPKGANVNKILKDISRALTADYSEDLFYELREIKGYSFREQEVFDLEYKELMVGIQPEIDELLDELLVELKDKEDD